MGKLQYIFSTNDIRIVNTEFTDEVVYDIELPADIKDRLVGEITDATSSRAVIDLGDEIFG
jgi:hypothetical protein